MKIKIPAEEICKNTEKNEPRDTFNIVHSLFFLLGIVHVLPYSFFTTATDYWMYKFRDTSLDDTSSEHRTNLQTNFSPSFTLTTYVTNLTFLGLTIAFGYKIKLKIRLIGSLTLMLAAFVAAAIFIKIDTDSWQKEFFAVSMIIVALASAMNSVFGLSIYTVIAHLPPIYLASYLNGHGLAAVFSAGLEILALAIGITTEASALVYFSLGIFLIAFTLFAFVATERRSKFYFYHMRNYHEGQAEKSITLAEAVAVSRKIWTTLAIVFTWLLTVNTVHPSVTSLVVSEGEGNGPWNDIYFTPVATFLLHALGDFIGRGIGTKLKINFGRGIGLTLISFSRIFLFVPLIMLCNGQPRHYLPVAFPYDYQYILIMICYSVSNGFFIILAGLQIPKLVTTQELKNAYEMYMIVVGIETSAVTALGFLTVKML